jgi:hypothetical protein
MKRSLLMLAAGLLLLASCKPSPPPKVTATDTGKSGPGAQTIKGGNVTLSLSADGKPVSYTIGNGTNLLRPNDPGPGFYMTTGTGAEEKTIPFVSSESKDGKLILTAGDKTRVTLAANAGDRFISFRLEKIEDVPKDSEPTLNFMVNFQSGVYPETVTFDYMCLTGGRFETLRSYSKATWPYLWQRSDNDPLGGFAFFVPQNDEEHNEALLRIWTEEKMPHPKVEGEWTYERAKQWAEEWKKNAEDTTHLMISAEKPEDLDPLIDYAKKLDAKRVYMHTDTWRGQYWVHDRDSLSVNTKVFPRGEEDLKAFVDKLKANGLGAMMHTLCYGIGLEGSKYMGKGKKTDPRLANWGKGKLEKPISATDTTILFRPDPGVKFPGPDTYPGYWKFTDVRIGEEIISCKFENTDQPVWTLKDCKRGAEPASHEAGTEVVGLLKAYGQNYYPDSRTDLPEITAKAYAEFFNRLGVQHHEYDGKECHDDVPWGFPKWAMFVYQNSKLPMTSNTSSGGSNPWDLMYRFKTNGADKVFNKGSNSGSGSGTAALALERDSRLATSPIENHFTMALGAVINTPGYVFEKPEPMFGVFPNVIHDHGLAPVIAEQFMVWREVAPKLTPELRKQISETYKKTPGSHHRNAKIVYEARRAGSGYEFQPFTIMTRGKEDADWTTVQEFAGILPRQYVAPGMRLKLDNPFGRQAPQFIIRVMSGYTDAAAGNQHAAPVEEMSKDMQDYLAASGAQVNSAAPAPAATPAAPDADPYRLQPKAAQMGNPGRHVFADVGEALEVSLDNSVKDEPSAETPAGPAATAAPAQAPTPKPGTEDYLQKDGFPGRAFKGNSQNARGLALTVTGDGSGALLVLQVGNAKDYVVPIDFTGRKDIFIPTSETSRTAGGWGMRYATKRATYGIFHGVFIGFGRVPANTHAKVLIENLRMVGEKPSSIKNPVIHAGEGTLAIQGEVKSDHYLWYQGGGKVGLYDKNWNLQAELPAVATNYEVDKGFSEYWIDGECPDPMPWLDVQFITKGETIKLDAPPAASR